MVDDQGCRESHNMVDCFLLKRDKSSLSQIHDSTKYWQAFTPSGTCVCRQELFCLSTVVSLFSSSGR